MGKIVKGFFVVFVVCGVVSLTSQFFVKRRISGIIIPHFDFAKEKRQEFLSNISRKVHPAKIVILSVNHYGIGGSDIIVSDKEWQFISGIPKINEGLDGKLVADNLVVKDNSPFLNEHGIKNVFPELFAVFPKATFLPIVINSNTIPEKISLLGEKIYKFCPECFLVASVDFSHDCTSDVSKQRDKNTLDMLRQVNEKAIWQTKTDSPQSLSLLINWAKKQNTKNFFLFFRSDSAGESSVKDIMTTSFVLGGFDNKSSFYDRIKLSLERIYGRNTD